VRYSRSNAVRAPAIYHNHYYVNRYGSRSSRWTPPVRIVHHHVNYSGWTYNPRYHSNYARSNFYYTDGVCRPSGGSVATGALVGALLGAAISDGDAGVLLAGGLIGGGLGAALSDCDRGQYHYASHYAFSTGNPYYWHNPYSGVRGVVYARDFHSWNNQRCRWGDAEIFLPNGEVAYDRVRMCQDNYGYWRVAPIQ
jgi:surface antigen